MRTLADYCNEDVARKVVYEFRMFSFLANALHVAYEESDDSFQPGDITHIGTGTPTDEEEATEFALLESFLLHTRVLRDFFYPERINDDDVIASHFVENWKLIRPEMSPWLAGHKQGLNKALAHLSIARLKYEREQKKWNVSALQQEIESLISRFMERLPDERKVWFQVQGTD